MANFLRFWYLLAYQHTADFSPYNNPRVWYGVDVARGGFGFDGCLDLGTMVLWFICAQNAGIVLAWNTRENAIVGSVDIRPLEEPTIKEMMDLEAVQSAMGDK